MTIPAERPLAAAPGTVAPRPAVAEPLTGPRYDGPPPNPALLHLLWPKWLTARAGAVADERGRGARFLILGSIGVLFWAFIFALLHRLLQYFRGVREIGPLLAGKLLG